MKKIIIVEDDKWILDSLKLYLENSQFIVDTYETWNWAVEKILKWDYDLVILDINLPEKDWIEICKELRKKSQVPVIMLTARTSELDKVLWLEIWADDYVSKPFSPRELLARINSIIRRNEINIKNKKDKKQILIYKNIKIDTWKVEAFLNDKEINLTKSEFDILKKLVEENSKLVTRDILMKEIIWYDQYICDRTLDTHIKNLRKKLENKEIIMTIRWEWYRMN